MARLTRRVRHSSTTTPRPPHGFLSDAKKAFIYLGGPASPGRRSFASQQEHPLGAWFQLMEFLSRYPIYRHPGYHARYRIHRTPAHAVSADSDEIRRHSG